MYFEITLTEISENEATDDHYLVSADSPEEATQKAAKCAATWYGEDEEDKGEYIEDLDHWSFFDGETIVSMSNPVETTLKKYFEDHLQKTHLIK